jgi:hypothetical protein
MAGNTIGMSVPGASSLMTGGSLSDQVAGETEEERRKRLLAAQQARLLPNSNPGASSIGLSLTGYSALGGG